MADRTLNIAYIGGGSRFVVTLLHALADRVADFADLRCCISLRLLDPANAPAKRMADYATIVAQQTTLSVQTLITADLHAAVSDADWVIFSPGLWRAYGPRCEQLLGTHVAEDSGPGCAIEATLAWPLLRQLGPVLQQRAPRTLFTTLVNPTDVLAAAFQQAYNIRSIGLCVEVPQLRRWLAYHLGCRVHEIAVQHVGLNHFGWVTQLSVAGVEALAQTREALNRRRHTPWYDPQNDFFLDLLNSTGLMRTSPYHPWPYARQMPPDTAERRAKFHEVTGASHDANMAAFLDVAFQQRRMIPDDEHAPITRWLHPYTYCTTRYSLAAIALSLAGGDGGTVPLQVQNGHSQPWLPADSWVEVPTRTANFTLDPTPVVPPPAWAQQQAATIAAQRRLLSQWLVSGRAQLLTESLLTWPEPIPLDRLLALPQLLSLEGPVA